MFARTLRISYSLPQLVIRFQFHNSQKFKGMEDSLRAYLMFRHDSSPNLINNSYSYSKKTEIGMESTKVRLELPILANRIVPDAKVWNVGRNRLFTLERKSGETLGHLFHRLKTSFDSMYSKNCEKIAKKDHSHVRNRYRLRVLDARMNHEDRPISHDTSLWSMLHEHGQTISPSLSFLLNVIAEELNPIGEVINSNIVSLPYHVQLNPARVHNFKIELEPMIGCPILPMMDACDFSYDQSIFHWFVSNESLDEVESKEKITWPEKPTFEGYVFYPREEHLGRFLRLYIHPVNERGEPGLPYRKPSKMNQVNDDDFTELLADFYEHPDPIKRGPKRSPLYASKQNNQIINQNFAKTDLPPSIDLLSFFYITYVNKSDKLIDSPKNRLKELNAGKPKEDTSNFRILSYNILADMYSRTQQAAEQIFIHCPTRYLNFRYRLPLILHELELYQPDVLCLQEVDKHVFEQYLVPFIRARLRMEGEICYKRMISYSPNPETIDYLGVHPAFAKPEPCHCHLDEEKPEGVAIFYLKDKFECLKVDKVNSLYGKALQMTGHYSNEILKSSEYSKKMNLHQIVSQTKALADLTTLVKESLNLDQNNQQNDYVERFRERAMSHSMCSLLLRNKTTEDGPIYAVGCSHLFFHADANFWRHLQALSAKVSLHNLALSVANDKTGVAVFFCADMNSDPPSLSIKSLTDSYDSDLVFQSAYPMDQALLKNPDLSPNVDDNFTNWVNDFSCMIDYIFYAHLGAKNKLISSEVKCDALAKLLSKSFITTACLETDTNGETDHTLPKQPDNLSAENIYSLPNAHFPSDHVALVADFKICVSKT